MNRPLAFAALSAFLLMFGLGVLFPVLPFYIRWLGLTEFQAGLLLSVYAGIGVILSPHWGRFSERYGRKPAIVIGLLGFSVGFFLFGLGRSFGELLAARLLGGLFSAAAMPAIFAYVADVTTSERRSVGMGVIGAAIGLGVVSGPVLGGVLAPLGLRLPFFVSAGLGLLTAIAVLLLLPESLDAEERDARRADGPVVSPPGFLRHLRPYLIYGFLLSASRVGFEATVGFLIADRFDGGPRTVGLLLGLIGLVGVAVQGGLIRELSRRFSDEGIMLTGSLFLTVGLAGLAVTEAWGPLTGFGIVMAIGYALSTPTYTAGLSRRGNLNQGRAQGLGQSSTSLGRVMGPLGFGGLYQLAGGGLTYGVAAVLGLLSCGVAWALVRSSGKTVPVSSGGIEA